MLDSLRFASELERRIEDEYRECGYDLGWRLLASPIRVLDGAKIGFIGLNPGGSVVDPKHATLAPSASAYVTECWAGFPAGKSPLQMQVRRLFGALGVPPDEVLAGNLVPFRSPNWSSLPHKERATAFGKAIWRDIFAQTRPEIVVAMGRLVYEAMAEILSAEQLPNIASGWGNVPIRRGINGKTQLVGLPHLSRFSLIGRTASQGGLATAFGAFWQRDSVQ